MKINNIEKIKHAFSVPSLKFFLSVICVLFCFQGSALFGTVFERVDFDWGASTTVAVSADYDGDGLVDPALYDENAGCWAILFSGSGYEWVNASFGGPGCRPVVGDFDGDGKTDLTVYRETTGEWTISLSGSGYQSVMAVLGGSGYLPAPGDYDGDGISEVAVYSPISTQWSIWWHVDPEVTDTNLLVSMFASAVTNAHNITPAKISRNLSPIASYNTNLVWSNGLVLVASFTKTYDYPQHIGGLYTNRAADGWVTLAPEARNFFRTYTGTNYLLRYKQLLGMPYTVGNNMIAEFWVDPQILFRPSPDPEINDREAQMDFSYTNSARLAVSQAHYSWFTNQVVANAWPWTRLGYTYDWGNSRSYIGLAEYVIPQGSVFIVHSITDAETYLRNQ